MTKPKSTADKAFHHSSVQRVWHGAKVVEATKPLRVFLLPPDIEGAERGNPTNCAFARAVSRACGTQRSVFMRSVAYVELMQKDGTKIVERFMLTPEMRDVIKQFDRTGDCPPGGFELLPFPASLTLEVTRQNNKKYRKALIKGKMAQVPNRGKHGPAIGVRLHGVRQVDGARFGAGMVQFPEVPKENEIR